MTTATTNLYTAGILGNSNNNELQRLRAFEAVTDPVTVGILHRIDLTTSARCLEIGAGAGSIARRLARHCPKGRVVATDIDTSLVRDDPDLKVVTHDVVHDDFPARSFDLVHARGVFSHLHDTDAVLDKVIRWVVPGGWIIIEDPLFAPLGPATHPSLHRILTGCANLIPAPETWPRTLPARLARAGLTDISCAPMYHVIGNGGPMDEFWLRSLAVAAPVLVERGPVTQQDIDGMANLLADKAFVDAPIAMMSAWGRRA